MKDSVAPSIMICGSERSGTNLLRALLSAHSGVASPPPAGFIDALGELQAHTHQSGGDGDRSALIEAVMLMTKNHHNPWDVHLDRDEIAGRMKDGSLWDIFRVVNELYAEKSGRPCWCSKEPGLFKYIRELAEHVPGAKFVYLVRDGRDVAASMLRGHLHAFHVYFAACNWVWTQRQCRQALADPALKDRIHLLKYEDLLDDPAKVMREVMEFVGLEFEESQLQYYKNEKVLKHSRSSRFWKNLAKPIDRKNKGGYKESLGPKDVEIFESVARPEMEAFGYKPDTPRRRSFSEAELKRFALIASLRRKFWSLDPRAEARRNRKRVRNTRRIMEQFR